MAEPNFVSSFAHGDYVYFTFREISIEHMNCGKVLVIYIFLCLYYNEYIKITLIFDFECLIWKFYISSLSAIDGVLEDRPSVQEGFWRSAQVALRLDFVPQGAAQLLRRRGLSVLL